MSYIRCLSNPEGLYIYGSSAGLEICFPAVDNRKTIICNNSDFEKFVRKWDSEGMPDEFSYKEFSIVEENRGSGEFKQYLKIGNEEIEMWHVTWMYIVHNVLRRK